MVLIRLTDRDLALIFTHSKKPDPLDAAAQSQLSVGTQKLLIVLGYIPASCLFWQNTENSLIGLALLMTWITLRMDYTLCSHYVCPSCYYHSRRLIMMIDDQENSHIN